MNKIEKLIALPSLVKVEGGYAFPEHFIGKLYQFESSLIYFATPTTYETVPSYMVAIITTLIENQTSDLEMDLISKSSETLDDMKELVLTLKSEITNDIMSGISDKLEIMNRITDSIQDVVDSAVDKKLTDVYLNFDLVVKQLVSDNVKTIEDSIKLSGTKFKIHEIAMLKESGLDIADIIELKKQGLV